MEAVAVPTKKKSIIKQIKRDLQVKESFYKATVEAICDRDRWEAIVTRAVEDATNGDRTARAWLTDIVMKKEPEPKNEPRTVNILNITPEELEKQKQQLRAHIAR